MYMKKGQISQIRDAAEEIKRLATLESCGLDEETKEKDALVGEMVLTQRRIRF